MGVKIIEEKGFVRVFTECGSEITDIIEPIKIKYPADGPIYVNISVALVGHIKKRK